jgi:hypothetical protein
MASKLIRKFTIDTEDPMTINYQKQLDHIIQETASDKAIQRMNAIQTASQLPIGGTDSAKPLAGDHEEPRPVEPMTKPAKSVKSSEPVTVEDLTKAFEKLSVNIIQQVQAQQQSAYPRSGGLYG